MPKGDNFWGRAVREESDAGNPMMPFEEKFWDLALKLCHATPGLNYLEIEKREGTLAWRIACELQRTFDIGAESAHEGW